MAEALIEDWGLASPTFFHCSRWEKGTYELISQPMALATEEEQLRANAADDEVCLRASGSWRKSCLALQQVPRVGVVMLDFFELCMHDRVSAEFVPPPLSQFYVPPESSH